MIRTVWNVVRGEGFASALRRAGERLAEASQGGFAGRSDARILNIGNIAARTGGVAVQLNARLRAERELRTVALLPCVQDDFERTVRSALAKTGAKAIHLEGTAGVPLDAVCRLFESGVRVVVSVHDFSLYSNSPHLMDPWAPADREQILRARRLLEDAAGVIFPSRFLLERHRELFGVELPAAEVVEPAVPGADRRAPVPSGRTAVAFAGSVKPHKGGHLLPEIARLLAARGVALHVFGGGDVDLLLPLRRLPTVTIHGYYRYGTLPALLAKHGVGLVLLPSIVAESYSLTLSEAWLAGAPVAAFDLGAPAERIRRDGGGWLVPFESGAGGLVDVFERWQSGGVAAEIPRVLANPEAVAREHVRLYREWGLLG